MRTMERLSRAYRNAEVLEIDPTSKIIIFSDAHRGDGSISDEFSKNRHVFYAALQYYYDEDFTLIEAGDNEDLWEWPKFGHIAKSYPLTYEFIRRFHTHGRYLRLYGNHDFQTADPNYVRDNLHYVRSPYSGDREPCLEGVNVHEAILMRHRDTRQEILIVHGHQGDFANDQAWRWSMFTFRIFWKYAHALGIRSPSSPTRNSYKRHKVERNYVRWILRNGRALICGHTHRERFPRANDAPYFNSGSCVFPSYITGLEIVEDQISLVTWLVVPDVNGYTRVVRRVIAGPRPLADFDLQPDPSRHRRPAKSLEDWTTSTRSRIRVRR